MKEKTLEHVVRFLDSGEHIATTKLCASENSPSLSRIVCKPSAEFKAIFNVRLEHLVSLFESHIGKVWENANKEKM